jgi:hypothetical protein
MGITPDRSTYPARPSLKRAALLVLACVRMRRGAEAWAKSRRIHERIVGKLDSMRRASVAGIAASPARIAGGAGAGGRSGGAKGERARKSLEGQLVSSRRVSELRSEGRRTGSGR